MAGVGNKISPYDTVAGFHYAFYSIANGSAASTWNNIGNTEEGWTLHRTIHEEDVKDDAYGLGVANRVQLGADYEISGLSINLNAAASAGVFDAQQAFGQTNNNVGKLASSLYGSLCLVPLPGTPAAFWLSSNFTAGNPVAGGGTGAACYIVGICAIANDYGMLLSSHQRKLQVAFKTIPDENNGNLCICPQALPSGITLPTAPPI